MDITLKQSRQLTPESQQQLKEAGLMTAQQYAKKIGKSIWAVQRLCRLNKIPCQKVSAGGNKAWLISKGKK